METKTKKAAPKPQLSVSTSFNFKGHGRSVGKEPIHLAFEYEGKEYDGEAVAISETCTDDICCEADVSMNDEDMGIISCAKSGWKMGRMEQGLVDAIGNQIFLHYE